MPAQHDTGWTTFPAALQARCDVLAAEGARDARVLCFPFPEETGQLALLRRGDRLVIDPAASLDDVYDHLLRLSALVAPLGVDDSTSTLAWQSVVTENKARSPRFCNRPAPCMSMGGGCLFAVWVVGGVFSQAIGQEGAPALSHGAKSPRSHPHPPLPTTCLNTQVTTAPPPSGAARPAKG